MDFVRSLLYVPVLATDYLAKAHSRGADAVIIDLEDSIALQRKTDARAALGEAVRRVADAGAQVWVRVNSPQDLLAADLEAAACSGVHTILLPKVESAAYLHQAEDIVKASEARRGIRENTIALAALIETPMGIMKLNEIGPATPRLTCLVFGSEDLSLGLGVKPEFDSLHIPAQMTVIAARAYGLSVYGVPGSVSEFRNLEAYRHLCMQSKTMGFDGNLCIHPSQVAEVNHIFTATADEIDYARRVIAAYEEAKKDGAGALALDGKMIDLPVVERAKKTLIDVKRLKDSHQIL